MDLEEINRELAAVQDALLELPDDAFAERHELRTRQDRLRDEAAQFRVDADLDRTDENLLTELAARRSQLGTIDDQRLDMVTQSGGGIGGGDTRIASAEGSPNTKMYKAQGAGEIRSRIARLEEILTDRGVDLPPN